MPTLPINLGIARWNNITEYLANHPDNLTTWNELERRDCSRTNRTYTPKTTITLIAVRQWYYGVADKSYRRLGPGTPRPCPSILDYRINGTGPSLEELMPTFDRLKEFTFDVTGINVAAVPARANVSTQQDSVTQFLTESEDPMFAQAIIFCESLNDLVSHNHSSLAVFATEYLNERGIYTSQAYFEENHETALATKDNFGSCGRRTLAFVLFIEFVALRERNVSVPLSLERYDGMKDKIDDLITGKLAFMRLAAAAMGQIESNSLNQAEHPDVFPHIEAAILQGLDRPESLDFIRHLSALGLDCSCLRCTDPNTSLIQTSEVAKTVQHLSAEAKQAKQDVSDGKPPCECPLSEMMKQFRRAGPGGIVNECYTSHKLSDLSGLINMVLGVTPKDRRSYSKRVFIQYGLLVDMKMKYGGGKCVHSGLPFTPSDTPAASQHHPVFGKGSDNEIVTSIRLIREDGHDIIISDMNKGGQENLISKLVHTEKSVNGFLGVVVPAFATTVLSLECYHHFFHQMSRYPQICAKYGIKFPVKEGGCVLLLLEDVPTLKVVVEEIESCGRGGISITSFENVTYADGDIDAATLTRVEAARYAAKQAIQYATESAAEEDSEEDDEDCKMPANEDNAPLLCGEDKSSLDIPQDEDALVETNDRTPKTAEEELDDDSPVGIAKPSSSDTAAAFNSSDDTPGQLKAPPGHNLLTSKKFVFDTDSKSAPVDNPKLDGNDSLGELAEDQVPEDEFEDVPVAVIAASNKGQQLVAPPLADAAANLPAIATKSTKVKKRKPNTVKQSGLGSFFKASTEKKLKTNRPPEQPPNKRPKPLELRQGELSALDRIALRQAVWLYGTNWDDVKYHVGRKGNACMKYWEQKVSDKDKNDWLGRHATLLGDQKQGG